VDVTSLLADILVHELAHCCRGHADARAASPSHGWLEEGDAQRDAWQVLTDLLTDDLWEAVAYEARAAQIRLAAIQPPAYRQFAVAGPEWAALSVAVLVPNRRTWIVHPARRVFRLVREHNVEVPITLPREAATPRVGDRVYLQDDEMLGGPWTLVAVDDRPRIGRLPDVQAARSSWRSATWWQLRAGQLIRGAAVEPADDESAKLVPVEVDDAPRDLLLAEDAMQIAASIAARVTEEERANAGEMLSEAHKENPTFLKYLDDIDGWED
jgi:hypothetical protein